MVSPCIKCSDATQYPDGALRCDHDLHLAIDGCPNIKAGHLKMFRPNMKDKVKRIIEEQQEPSKTRDKIRGSPTGKRQKKVTQEQGKLF